METGLVLKSVGLGKRNIEKLRDCQIIITNVI